MKREELTALGLTEEQINEVMKKNGEDITREQKKFADYDDIKAQLEKANATLNSMKDYDEVKAKVTEYQQQAQQARADADAKVHKLELQAKIKDFTAKRNALKESVMKQEFGELAKTIKSKNRCSGYEPR